jgi:Holliday junction resolvase
VTRYERELVRVLDDLGFGVVRAPSSGAATDRDLPDLLALSPTVVGAAARRPSSTYALAIEQKTTSRTTAYADGPEVEALVAFADAAGAVPLIGGRFKRQGSDRLHYLVRPGDCRMTDSGTYGVPAADAEDRAAVVVNATDRTLEADIETLLGE